MGKQEGFPSGESSIPCISGKLLCFSSPSCWGDGGGWEGAETLGKEMAQRLSVQFP